MDALQKLVYIAMGLILLAALLFWAYPKFIDINEYRENANEEQEKEEENNDKIVELCSIHNHYLRANIGQNYKISFNHLKINEIYNDFNSWIKSSAAYFKNSQNLSYLN